MTTRSATAASDSVQAGAAAKALTAQGSAALSVARPHQGARRAAGATLWTRLCSTPAPTSRRTRAGAGPGVLGQGTSGGPSPRQAGCGLAVAVLMRSPPMRVRRGPGLLRSGFRRGAGASEASVPGYAELADSGSRSGISRSRRGLFVATKLMWFCAKRIASSPRGFTGRKYPFGEAAGATPACGGLRISLSATRQAS